MEFYIDLSRRIDPFSYVTHTGRDLRISCSSAYKAFTQLCVRLYVKLLSYIVIYTRHPGLHATLIELESSSCIRVHNTRSTIIPNKEHYCRRV